MNYKLTKLTEEEKFSISGAGVAAVATATLTALPSVINVLMNLIGVFKGATSHSGELKTKENTIKWDNSETKNSASSKNPIYFVY
ncbi:hypothetical protein [Mesomycoplasma hyorhinis]|uniref:hypothetical protein n=1 Tax=Mesomycoplasma hyorhinis TaxID=2100 RepID=UPI001C047C8F|nr:hypothetical protein [Mesomycoplasma hyorhinis]